MSPLNCCALASFTSFHVYSSCGHRYNIYSDTLFGLHFTYEPLKCKRYLGDESWCEEEFTSKFELSEHRKNCYWVCSEFGCGYGAEGNITKKMKVDKHGRKHAVEKKKMQRISRLMMEP